MGKDELCKTIAVVLSELISTSSEAEEPTVYCGGGSQVITVEAYLQRFMKYIPDMEQNLCTSMLIYLDRYLTSGVNRSLNERNVHRIIACCLLLAYKQHKDTYCSNGYFAQIAGVSLRELNRLERHFYKDLDYKLSVSGEEFYAYSNQLFTFVEENRLRL
jgi:hypothetical protein